MIVLVLCLSSFPGKHFSTHYICRVSLRVNIYIVRCPFHTNMLPHIINIVIITIIIIISDHHLHHHIIYHLVMTIVSSYFIISYHIIVIIISSYIIIFHNTIISYHHINIYHPFDHHHC